MADGSVATGPDTGPGSGLRADLVLEGGGAKGPGLVGAVTVLAAAGYRFPRVAGSSAGAVVGALVAALERAGEPPERLADVAASLDLARLDDRGPIGRRAGPLTPLVDLASLLLDGGVYEGEHLHDAVAAALRDLGVRTFGDLRAPDPGSSLPPEQQYGLVVTASDLSRRRLVRLPWDYPAYGLDPDEQPVARAVRASASIPFFFEPVTLRGARGAATLVDGGLVSSFPIALFDRTDGRPPRWPTFGVRLSGRLEPRPIRPVRGPLSLVRALVETVLAAGDAQHVDEPCVRARTVFVDTSGVSPLDFDLDPSVRARLRESGATAARRFLAGWDEERYLAECREFES